MIPAHYHNAHINGMKHCIEGTHTRKLLNRKDAFNVPIINSENNEINVGMRIRKLSGKNPRFIGFIQKAFDSDVLDSPNSDRRRSIQEDLVGIDIKNSSCNNVLLETIYNKLPTELSKLVKQVLEIQVYSNDHYISLFETILILTKGTNDVQVSTTTSLVNVLVSCHVRQLFRILETIMKQASSVCKIVMCGIKPSKTSSDEVVKFIELDISCALFSSMPNEETVYGLLSPLYIMKRICIMIEADLVVYDNNLILRLPYKYRIEGITQSDIEQTCQYCRK